MSRVLFCVVASILFSGVLLGQKKGHQLKFSVPDAANDTVYLANYFGNKLYYTDTAYANTKGNFQFSGKTPLKHGKYAVVLSKENYFEVIVEEQHFDMATKAKSPIEYMVIKDSPNNEIYYDYAGYIALQKQKAAPLEQAIKNAGDDKKKAKEYRKQLIALDKKVKEYQSKLVAEHGDKLVGKYVNMTREIVIPPAPKNDDGSIDSTFSYRYLKSHYWDNVDLADGRMVKDPAFHRKMDYYFDKMILQQADTVIMEADNLIQQVKHDSDTYKYVITHILNKFNQSKIMGIEGVYVHLAKNYYCNGNAFWADSSTVDRICERSEAMEATLIGKKAPFLCLQDTAQQNWISLYEIDAPFTLLIFWASDCGHCKKEIPKLYDLYTKYKDKGLAVYAVATDFETKEWKKFVKENNLGWINVSDNPEIHNNAVNYLRYTTVKSLNFRDTYDIYSTPRVFLLDENKIIKAKQLNHDQLDTILDRELSSLEN